MLNPKNLSNWTIVQTNNKIPFALENGTTTIGRQGQIKISDMKISKVHGNFFVDNEMILYEDTSRHGSWIHNKNSSQFIQDETAYCYEETIIKIGKHEFKVKKIEIINLDCIEEMSSSDSESIISINPDEEMPSSDSESIISIKSHNSMEINNSLRNINSNGSMSYQNIRITMAQLHYIEFMKRVLNEPRDIYEEDI